MVMSKFLPHGTGCCSAATHYLLHGHHDDGVKVEVLRGNPQQVADLANVLSFKQKYKSLVVAFHPKDQPSTTQIIDLIEVYEQHMFAGLTSDQYATAWVQHTRPDGMIDLHMITPCLELTTGKSLNIAPPKSLKYMAQVRDYLNLKYNWDSPNIAMSPENKAIISREKHPVWASNRAQLAAQIHSNITSVIADGLVSSQQELVAYLSDIGLEVTRQNKAGISVKAPNMKRAMRLKGSIYGQSFSIHQALENEAARTGRRDSSVNEAAVRKAYQRLQSSRTRREKYHAARYGTPQIHPCFTKSDHHQRHRRDEQEYAPNHPGKLVESERSNMLHDPSSSPSSLGVYNATPTTKRVPHSSFQQQQAAGLSEVCNADQQKSHRISIYEIIKRIGHDYGRTKHPVNAIIETTKRAYDYAKQILRRLYSLSEGSDIQAAKTSGMYQRCNANLVRIGHDINDITRAVEQQNTELEQCHRKVDQHSLNLVQHQEIRPHDDIGM